MCKKEYLEHETLVIGHGQGLGLQEPACYLNLLMFNFIQVYIIDFGLAKKYRDPSTHQHIPYRYCYIIVFEHD